MMSDFYDVPPADQFAVHYVEWRKRRIDAILQHYGEYAFRGRTLLELGCGQGDIGATFAKLGARVTASDARAEHIAIARERHPQIEFVCADLDNEWPFNRHFDFILHQGLLYHLEPTHRSLHKACQACDHLILETEVCDASDPTTVVLVEEKQSYDQAFNRKGCRPSASRVETVLAQEGLCFERVNDARCNSGFHVYDWQCSESGNFRDGLRRFWFANPKPSFRPQRDTISATTDRRKRVGNASRMLPIEYGFFVNEIVGSRIAELAPQRLGILGAGNHTTLTFQYAPWLAERVRVLADSNPTIQGETRYGRTVVSPAALLECDLVYLSSAFSAAEMRQTLAASGYTGTSIAPEDIVPSVYFRSR